MVDERLWNDEDDGKDKDKDKNKDKSEKYEKNAPIQVEDKTDLEYAAGQEEEQQDGPGKEPPKKEQGKDKKKDEPVGAMPYRMFGEPIYGQFTRIRLSKHTHTRHVLASVVSL